MFFVLLPFLDLPIPFFVFSLFLPLSFPVTWNDYMRISFDYGMECLRTYLFVCLRGYLSFCENTESCNNKC